MIASRKLEDLIPKVGVMARNFINRCQEQGIDVIITSTYRDDESQAALYAQGRTAPGRRVTNAKPGFSWHQHRCAFDFAPLKHGKIDWDDLVLFRHCGEIGEACGLEWAGRWKSFNELAHMQYTGGLTIAQLQKGAQIG